MVAKDDKTHNNHFDGQLGYLFVSQVGFSLIFNAAVQFL